MSKRSLIYVLLSVLTAAMITFGSDAFAARAQQCPCVQEPDMTAFGFVTNPQPKCYLDSVQKNENRELPGAGTPGADVR